MQPRFLQRIALGLAVLCTSSLVTAVLCQDNPESKSEKEPAPGESKDLKQPPKTLDQRQWRIGELIEDLPFTDLEGKPGRLSDFKGKPLVLAMTNTTCPICKKYAPTLVELQKECADLGVHFVFLNASTDESAKIKDANTRYGFTARYIVDAKGEIAGALRATSTGDCFVLDAARTLRYRGAVDDQYGLGYALDKPRANYARDAIKDVLAGKPPLIGATWAPGCALEFKPAAPTGEITWHNRVSRILETNCQECHRSGENGPFELVTYDDAKANAPTIKRVVKNGTMPPWFASPEHGDWSNNRSLSEADKKDLLGWIENGCKLGDEKDAAAKRDWPQGWRIGTPDAIVKVPQPFKVPAKGTVQYQYRYIGTDFDSDKWIQAMEIRSTARQAVHHVLIFLIYPPTHPRAKEQPDDAGGTRGYFMGMVPGQGHIVLPQGQGKFLPKGSRMVFQIHYTTNGETYEDETSLGMIFCKERPDTEIKTVGISNERFRIPAGADNHEVRSVRRLESNCRILSFMPHMHVRGKAYRYEVEYPDGRTEVLLDIPRYDFNWQLIYILREPIDLPKGSKIICTGWFDNSDKNPANPDPKKDVRFGEQTWEEMQIGYVNLYELPN